MASKTKKVLCPSTRMNKIQAPAVAPKAKAVPKKVKRGLQNQERIDLIKGHRAMIDATKNMSTFCSHPEEPGNFFGDFIPKDMKPIKLRNMKADHDWLYSCRVVYLTVIDEPMLGFWRPIHLICEDETSGEACRVSIHGIPHSAAMKELLGVGQQIAVIYPYWRIAMDGNCGIRVDEPDTVFILGKKKNMCGYCGKENAPNKCARCKMISYCDRKCQETDWKELDHKKVCHKKK